MLARETDPCLIWIEMKNDGMLHQPKMRKQTWEEGHEQLKREIQKKRGERANLKIQKKKGPRSRYREKDLRRDGMSACHGRASDGGVAVELHEYESGCRCWSARPELEEPFMAGGAGIPGEGSSHRHGLVVQGSGGAGGGGGG